MPQVKKPRVKACYYFQNEISQNGIGAKGTFQYIMELLGITWSTTFASLLYLMAKSDILKIPKMSTFH